MREQHLDGIVLTETKTAESPEDLFRPVPGSGAVLGFFMFLALVIRVASSSSLVPLPASAI